MDSESSNLSSITTTSMDTNSSSATATTSPNATVSGSIPERKVYRKRNCVPIMIEI